MMTFEIQKGVCCGDGYEIIVLFPEEVAMMFQKLTSKMSKIP